MQGLYFPRILDITILGPLKIVLSYYTSNDTHGRLLSWGMFITGILTIVYNYYNYCIIDNGVIPSNYINLPSSFKRLFFDREHGKTQLLRLINLAIMYPILYLAYLNIKSNVASNTSTMITLLLDIYLITLIGGFIFNAYNYIAIDRTLEYF